MRLPLALIAALFSAGSVAAEPAEDSPAKGAERQPRPAEIVLAAADTVPLPGPEAAKLSPASPKRKVAPRVTSCRCGDPQTVPDSPDQ